MSLRTRMLSLVLLSLLLSPAFAEQVVNPYDYSFSNKWYLTAIYNAQATQADTNLKQLMNTDLRWRDLQSRVIFTEWDTGSNWLRSSNWAYLLSTGRKPILLLQAPHRADGKAPVIFYGNADTVVFDNTLFDRVASVAATYTAANPARATEQCPFVPKRPAPAPATPSPTPPPLAPLVPTPSPSAPVEEDYIPVWALLLPILGTGAGLWRGLKEET
jgi:hypothetical protein